MNVTAGSRSSGTENVRRASDEQAGGDHPDGGADERGEDELGERGVVGGDDLEHDQGEGGADRIDDDALPPEDRGGGLAGPGDAEQGPDHGGPADDEQGAEQHRQVGREAEERHGDRATARPR